MNQAQQGSNAVLEPTEPSKQLHQDVSTADGAAPPFLDGEHAAQPQQHSQPPAAAPYAEPVSGEQQQQQQQAPLPDPRHVAIAMLRGIGVSDDRAAEAVDQTRDVFVSIDAAA